MVTLSDQASFLDVDRVVSVLGIAQGQKVVDLGCGSGYFVMALAKAVGASGAVIAVDVMQEALQSVHARAEALDLNNVQVVRADIEVLGGTKIPDGSQDLALLKNVLFQSQKKESMIREAIRVTRPGGRVVIIDWKKGAGGLGPPDNLRTEESVITGIGTSAGLRLDGQFAVDQFHLGLIFAK